MEKRNLKVLIADDERTIRMVFKKVLSLLGVENVIEAESGQQAIEMFREHHPDLLLLDINMPNLNGDEALEQIHQEAPNVRAIMLTSVAEMDVVKRCILLGATNYILKNNPLDKIKLMLQDSLDRI